jgi:hypothetical protein
MNRSMRVMGLCFIAAVLFVFAIPAHSQETLAQITLNRKRYVPNLVAGYHIAVVIDYRDTSLDLERLGLTADVLEDQLGLTVIPTLGKAMRQDKTQRFDAMLIVGAALDELTPDENTWLARFFRERGVVGFIDIPIVEQRAALKLDCEYQKINDYPWPWAAVHVIENIRPSENIDTREPTQQRDILDLPERCSPEWKESPERERSGARYWAIVDDIDGHGGAYYAVGFIASALDLAHGGLE